MATQNLTIAFDKLGDKLVKRLSTKLTDREILETVLRNLDRISKFAATHVIKTSLSGQRLNRRTGTLARSTIGQSVLQNGMPGFRVGIFRGPALAYARLQEEGGVIKPVNAKALSIPQKAVMTRAGVDKYGGPRRYPGDLKFLPFRRGIAVGKLVDQDEVDALKSIGANPYNATALYILVKQVTIPRSAWLSGGVRSYLPQAADEILAFIRELAIGKRTI